MGLPRTHGTPIAQGAQPSVALSGGIGDVNLMVRGTTLGIANGGESAGFLDAVWVVVQLAGTETVLSVAHALGRIPAWAHLWEVEDVKSNSGQLTLTSWSKSAWSASEIKLRISGSGNFAGYRLLILVG